MVVGSILVRVGLKYSSEVALYLFETVHRVTTSYSADFALANRTQYSLLLAGLLLYLIGVAFAVRELKMLNIVTLRRRIFYVINILLIIFGTVFLVPSILYIIRVIRIGLIWR